MRIKEAQFAPHWDLLRVGEVCESIVPGRNKPKVFDGDIPWINITDLSDFYIMESHEGLGLSYEEINNCGNKVIPPNAVIMTCIGQFGIIGIAQREIVINQQLHAFVCPSELNPYFLATVLKMQEPYMERVSTQTTIKYMNKASCESIPIPLPPLEEQRAIADILGTWDEAIALTECLIDALQERKKGLMQKLLTGEVRFSEGEAWTNTRVGKVADTTAGGTPSTRKSEYWDNGDIPWMKSGDIHLKWIDEVEGRITHLGFENSSAKLIPENSVLIALAGQGKTRGTVAVNNIELTTNQSVAAIIPYPTKVHYAYLFYDLESRYEQLRLLSTGTSGRGGLNLKIIKNIKMKLPPLDEQIRIVDVLYACDKELFLLEEHIAALQQQKKGLMQQLLTGQVRVKVER